MEVCVGDTAAVVYEEAVAVRLFDTPAERVSFEGTPPALALNAARGQGPERAGPDEDEVGLVALAQETAVLDVEEGGGVVAHELDEALDG